MDILTIGVLIKITVISGYWFDRNDVSVAPRRGRGSSIRGKL